MRVLVVGAGFAGKHHAEAWRSLGHDVRFLDPFVESDYSSMREALDDYNPDAVDFCDPPASRLNYLLKYQDELEGREIYVEKPPCMPRVEATSSYEYLAECLKITPIHNYLFIDEIPRELPLEIVILRNGPHQGWYMDPCLTGGGILLDHGYHWLYIAHSEGLKLSSVNVWLDAFPDRTCIISSDAFTLYATWNSPLRLTVINKKVCELRLKDKLVRSFAENFQLSGKERRRLRHQSIELMWFLSGVYSEYEFWRRDEDGGRSSGNSGNAGGR